MEDTQIAVNEAKMPILATNMVDKSVSPQYIWKSGKTFFLSRKEKVVADCFIMTRSIKECCLKLHKECGKVVGVGAVRRWLERGHMKEYMAEQMEERGMTAGWTKERWVAVMTRHLKGEVRLANGDLYGMSLIAKVKGFEVPDVKDMGNLQINITQSNGRE